MRVDTFSTMIHLTMLILEVGYLKFSGSLSHLSSELRYLLWKCYHFQCLPPSFEPDKLGELVLHESGITELWKDPKVL